MRNEMFRDEGVNIIHPGFVTFVCWLCETMTADEARRLAEAARERLERLGELPRATRLEASLEAFLDILADYHDLGHGEKGA